MRRIFINILTVLILISLLCVVLYRFFKLFPTLFDRWGLLALLICGILFVGFWILLNIATKKKWIWLLEFLQTSPGALPFLDRKSVLFPEARAFLEEQKEMLRQLTHTEVTLISITFHSGSDVRIQDPKLIASFKKYLPGHLVHLSLPDAILKYEKVQQLKLEIHSAKDAFTCVGFINPQNPEHIILSYQEGNDYGGICLHNLKRWVEENGFWD